MKNIVIFIFTLSSIALNAQSYEISAYSGFTFADRFNINGGSGRVDEGFSYGASFSYLPVEDYSIDLIFTRIETRGRATSTGLGVNINEDISVNYILAGGSRIVNFNEKAAFYSGLKIGAVVISSKRDAFYDITRFAAGFNAGFKFLFTNQIGIKAQANLFLPITDVGGYLWWSPGTGTSIGVTTATPILQVGFLGGAYFKF